MVKHAYQVTNQGRWKVTWNKWSFEVFLSITAALVGSVFYMDTLERHWLWVAEIAKCGYCKESAIASIDSLVEMVFTSHHESFHQASCWGSHVRTSKVKKMVLVWIWTNRVRLNLESCRLQRQMSKTKYFQLYIISDRAMQYVRTLADIIMLTLVFHFKGHSNTIPKVVLQCPCHFLWPHLDFLTVCSSCHPMLILPFPT